MKAIKKVVRETKKISKNSDLNKKNSMKSDKVIGDFNEDFRETPIIDRGNRASNMIIMTPIKGEEHMQSKPDKSKNF